MAGKAASSADTGFDPWVAMDQAWDRSLNHRIDIDLLDSMVSCTFAPPQRKLFKRVFGYLDLMSERVVELELRLAMLEAGETSPALRTGRRNLGDLVALAARHFGAPIDQVRTRSPRHDRAIMAQLAIVHVATGLPKPYTPVELAAVLGRGTIADVQQLLRFANLRYAMPDFRDLVIGLRAAWEGWEVNG